MFKEALLETIDAERQDLISFLQSLTRADSSNPPGETIAAACVVTTFLAARDVPATLIAPKSVDRISPAPFQHCHNRQPTAVLHLYIN